MPFDLIVGRNASNKKAFGMRGLAYFGKSFVTMGNYTSLSNPSIAIKSRSVFLFFSHTLPLLMLFP